MTYQWKDLENNTSYFYREQDGLIVAQVHNLAHTKIWIAKGLPNGMPEEKYLGQYITLEFAKRSVERWIGLEDNTLLDYGSAR